MTPIRFYESAPRASLTEMYVALMAGAVITAGTGFTVVIDGLRHLPRRDSVSTCGPSGPPNSVRRPTALVLRHPVMSTRSSPR